MFILGFTISGLLYIVWVLLTLSTGTFGTLTTVELLSPIVILSLSFLGVFIVLTIYLNRIGMRKAALFTLGALDEHIFGALYGYIMILNYETVHLSTLTMYEIFFPALMLFLLVIAIVFLASVILGMARGDKNLFIGGIRG